MEIIESIKPLKINKCIIPILGRASILSRIDNNKMYLLFDKEKINDKLLSDLNEWLNLLKKYRYIESFNKVHHLQWNRYKEEWLPIKDLSEYISEANKNSTIIPFAIYFYKNIEKWEYLKNVFCYLEEKKLFKIDLEIIDKIIYWYLLKNKVYYYFRKNVQPENIIFLWNNYNLDREILEDFLIFYSYSNKKSFDNFVKNVLPIVEISIDSKVKMTDKYIRNSDWKIILKFTNNERNIIKEIKKFDKDWWISKSSLIKILKTTEGAFKKALSTLRKKIKDWKLDNHIKIKLIEKKFYKIIKSEYVE